MKRSQYAAQEEDDHEGNHRIGVGDSEELLDELVKGPMSEDELTAVCLSLKKAIIERAMGAEVSQHLGYQHGDAKPPEQANHRNGTSGKTVLTDEGPVRIEVPRARDSSFEPLLVGKQQRRFTRFDHKIVAMYALLRLEFSWTPHWGTKVTLLVLGVADVYSAESTKQTPR